MKKSARILVVDDETEMLSGCAKILKAIGHQPFLAQNGETAQKFLQEEELDLVLCDLLMPDIDGIAVVKQLPDLHPNTKILAISGGGDAMPAQWSLRLTEMYGTDAVLYKPFGNQQFIDTVKRLLSVELAET